MSASDVYSNVNLKAKTKSKPALTGEDDSDYVDYSLIDFTTSGNNRPRSKACSSEAVTYSAVRVPQPGPSKQQERKHDGDSDDSDYSLFDFTPSANDQGTAKAASSKTVTYSRIKTPKPDISQQPGNRNGANSDDTVYYKITLPQREAAQVDEFASQQSVHTPVAFTSQREFTAPMSPVREIKQRLFLSTKFLLSLNLLFLLFVIILGILFSSEKKAHQDTMGRYEYLQSSHKALNDELSQSHASQSVTSQSLRDLNISYVKVQGEKTSLEKDLNVSRGEAKALTTKYNSLSQEKTSLQAELKSVWSSWQVEITKTRRLTREKNSKDEELARKRTELIKRDETITQLRQSNTKISQYLEETNKNLNEQKRNNTLWSHLKESIEKEMKKYKDKQPSQIRDQEKTFLDSVLQVLETGCDFTWTLAGGKCFFFSFEKHTWEQSRDDCQAKKGELAFTPTETEWEILKKAIPGNSKKFYWIGLTDSDTEGSWRWVDNKTITINHWLNNDPDNWTNNDTKPEGENCAKMNAVEGGWMDAFCDEQISYICETKAAV